MRPIDENEILVIAQLCESSAAKHLYAATRLWPGECAFKGWLSPQLVLAAGKEPSAAKSSAAIARPIGKNEC